MSKAYTDEVYHAGRVRRVKRKASVWCLTVRLSVCMYVSVRFNSVPIAAPYVASVRFVPSDWEPMLSTAVFDA